MSKAHTGHILSPLLIHFSIKKIYRDKKENKKINKI